MTKKELIKQRIKNAAIQCFIKYGLEKTTLDDIAKLMGLNKATFYYYYKNKEEIFLEVAIHEGAEFLKQLQQKTLALKGYEKRVLFYLIERIRYYRDVLTVNKVSAATLINILPKFFEMYKTVKLEELQFIAAQLKEGIRMDELQKNPVDKLALALLNLSDSMKHKAEQDAVVEKKVFADYETAIAEMQFLIQLIFKSIKK
jgi:TetR/AcrR family transcriptional regulator, biofilm operon repressor